MSNSSNSPVPQVSVLLPAYNAENTLGQALDSLLEQTMHDFEIVVVDDGSADFTADCIQKYADNDARVRPLLREHEGLVAALNSGLEASRGSFIARMDADDTCHPDRLKLQVSHLNEHPEVGLVGSCVSFGGDAEEAGGLAHYVERQNSFLSREDISINRFVESPFAHPSVMFRADVPKLHGAYRNGAFPEDYELWLRWLDAGVVMDKLPQELVVWNDPPNRLTRTDERYSVEAFYRTKALYLARWLKRNNPHYPNIWLAGAGRVARKRAEMLLEYGVVIKGYLDIDPQKIGQIIHGCPVVDRDNAPPADSCFLVSYVGSRGAGEDMVAYYREKGFYPGHNFILAA